MPKRIDPTLRQQKVSSAAKMFNHQLGARPCLHVELVADKVPAADVLMYTVVELADGNLRAGILYDWPGRDNALYHVQEGDRSATVRWLSQNGIPTVRLSGLSE